jgi:hypothetical protein
MSTKEVKKDDELPASLKELERILDACGCCFPRIWARHTFW